MVEVSTLQELNSGSGRNLLALGLLVVGAAGFYAGTMVLMKYWGFFSPIAMAVLIAGAFALGAWCEVEALKVERLSTIYVAILGVECVIISLVSFTLLGESLSLREAAGGVLVLSGVALAAT